MVVVYSLIRTGRTYKLVRRRCFKQGFFRRSTLQKLQYRSCGKNQQCSIGRINRNGCQHCRLRKCIAVGMSRNAVRFGRVPNQERAKILAAMQKVNVKSQDKVLKRLNSELEDENRLVNTILSAYEDAFAYSRDNVIVPANKESDFNHCLPQLAYPLQTGSNPLAIGTNSNNEDFSERFSIAIGGIVEFAKKIPGFNLLPQDDQKTLLKAGVFEVLLVRLACTLDTQDNSMVCLNGQRLQRGKIHPTSSAFFLLDSMFEFAERLNSMKLVVRELGLFNAIVLIAPDRPDLQNADLVSAVHKKLADVLQKVLTSRQCENLSYFTEVMKMIRDLRTLHCQSLLAYKVEPQSMEDLKPMVSESSILKSSSSHLQALLRPDNQFLGHSERNIRSPAQNILGCETVDYIKNCNGRLDSKSGMTCSDKEKNSFRCLSFTNTHNLENIVPEEHGCISDLHSLKKSVDHTFEQNVSSGDESYISYGSDSPKQMHHFKLKRSESPFDSGIESGLEHGHMVTPNNSVCSSPQSLEEKAKGVSEFDEKHDSQNHMSVLKRALEAPPLVNTSLMMEDLCKPHKKFHAAYQDLENFTTTTSLMTSVHGHCQTKVSLSNDHSTLIATLKKPSQFLNEEQIKRSDFIHNIIMRTESVSANIAFVNSGSIPVSAGADNNLVTQLQAKKNNEKTVYNIDCAGSMGIPQTRVFVDNDQSKQKVMVYPSSYCITGQIRETVVSNGFPQVESSHACRKSHSNPRVFDNNYTTIVSAPLVAPPLGNITDVTTPLDLTKRSFVKDFEP